MVSLNSESRSRLCERCPLLHLFSQLHLYQVNNTEANPRCPGQRCTEIISLKGKILIVSLFTLKLKLVSFHPLFFLKKQDKRLHISES